MSGGRPSRSPAAQARRARIIHATRELLREREADKVIVVDIAERAGVAPATIYNLVGTRDEVLVAVLDDAVAVVASGPVLIDPQRPVDTVLDLIACSMDVLASDPLVFRRAIGAMSFASPGVFVGTTLKQMLIERLVAVAESFDGSIPVERLAELIHIGLRGSLISWSYGHLDDDQLALSGAEIGLHVLSTTARPDIAFDIKRRLIRLAQEQ